jgi:hypothetical protein
MTLPAELLSKIGGPGIFEAIKVDQNELSIARVTGEHGELETRPGISAANCPACDYEYESAEADTCARCGALKARGT